MLSHLEQLFKESKELAHAFSSPEEVDVVEFGKALEAVLSHEEMAAMMELSQGPGLILGTYLHARKVEEENELLREVEDEEAASY